MSYTYTILRPSGNDTALIEGIVDDPIERKHINDEIMARHATVEQVGFVDREHKQLMMAGGEFCGNATRAAAWLILDGKEGELRMAVSGSEDVLRAGVDSHGNAWVEIPTAHASVRHVADGYIVDLPGISHLIVENYAPAKNAPIEELKLLAKKLLETYQLVEKAAAGVMFVSRTADTVFIQPVVYVKAIDTLFYETACGSGTTAVGLLLRQSMQAVRQPSGMNITVSKTKDGLIVSGVVTQLR